MPRLPDEPLISSTIPEVSVVIPTCRRPTLLLRALASVFAQTYQHYEVIVVVDGPDQETLAALSVIRDARLRVFVNPRSLSAAGARNRGVKHARGHWIAFLDDDDEWLPQKLERQMACALSSGPALVTALSRVVTPVATYVWPGTVFDNVLPIDEYLFDRQALFAGESFIQTSSYVLPRAAYQGCPFRSDTPHDDWDFLLRLCKQRGMRVETVPEVLVQVHCEGPRLSLSQHDSWVASLYWLDSIRSLITPRAYSGFCLGVVGPRAANEHAYSAFFLLLLKALRNGAPRPRQVLVFLSFWAMPQGLRRRLRALVGVRREG